MSRSGSTSLRTLGFCSSLLRCRSLLRCHRLLSDLRTSLTRKQTTNATVCVDSCVNSPASPESPTRHYRPGTTVPSPASRLPASSPAALRHAPAPACSARPGRLAGGGRAPPPPLPAATRTPPLPPLLRVPTATPAARQGHRAGVQHAARKTARWSYTICGKIGDLMRKKQESWNCF